MVVLKTFRQIQNTVKKHKKIGERVRVIIKEKYNLLHLSRKRSGRHDLTLPSLLRVSEYREMYPFNCNVNSVGNVVYG